MCKTLMASIKTLQKEYEINHQRWQKSRVAEEGHRVNKFELFEKHFRKAIDVYRTLQKQEGGIDSFLPEGTYFEKV